MGLRASFSVTQDLDWPEFVLGGRVMVDYSFGNRTFVDTFLREARRLVPVDTGRLKGSIAADCDDDRITCEVDCDYAQYVEYGTWKMREQPYFEPALQAALEEAEPAWQRALDEASKSTQNKENNNRRSNNTNAKAGAGGKGLGGFFGSLLGMIVGAIIVGIMRVFGDIISGGQRSSNSGAGGSDISSMNIEIT